jgi:outer membrane receptor protein involved in Fe transport
VKLKLSGYLTFFAEYNPRTKFYTVSDFVADNRYYNFSTADNIFEKYKISFNGSLKYEFGKYFEIIAGAKYAKIDNYIYYSDNLSSAGFFDLVTANDVKKINVYSNANFHLGPFGYFYGEAAINDVKDNNGNYIPYTPKISASLVYGYNFKMGVGFKLKYDFKKDYYTNIVYTQIISGYHNFAVSLNYEFIKNLSITLDLENLLNRKNYLWNGYEEKPFDIIAGIDYRW